METTAHWYCRETAASRHRIVGKNGKERATTIRDARDHGYLPSVTTILSILAKPELERWRHRQVAMAALTHPRPEGVALDEAYLDQVIDDAFEQVEDAADLGTRIHAAIEGHFAGGTPDPEMVPYLLGVERWLAAEREAGRPLRFTGHELRLTNAAEGYAGTTDAAFQVGPEGRGICDFKSRKTKAGVPCTPWGGQAAQIAAYHMANYGKIRDGDWGINVFISTTEPGRVEACWYDASTLRAEWEFFRSVAACWRHLKSYDPRCYP